MKLTNVLIGTCVLFFICGCGSGRTIVKNQPSENFLSKSVTLEEDLTKGGAQIDRTDKEHFVKHLKEKLFEKKQFIEGDGLKIKYYFSDADKGSRSERYFGGFGAGTGTIHVIVDYIDKSGTAIVSTESIGTVTGGGFGGSFDTAIEHAADEIAKYTIKQFLKNKP